MGKELFLSSLGEAQSRLRLLHFIFLPILHFFFLSLLFQKNLLFDFDPFKVKVILDLITNDLIFLVKQLKQILVIGLLVKIERAYIAHVFLEAGWVLAKCVGAYAHFGLDHFPILLLLEFNPWQVTILKEVKKNVAYCFKIVPPTLFLTFLRIHTAKSQRACGKGQYFGLNMLTSLGTLETLGETKINKIEGIDLFALANQEVFWFKVSVDVVLLMHRLNSQNHLLGNPKNCFHIEMLLTKLKQALQARALQIHNNHIVISLYPFPVHFRKPNLAFKLFVEYCLILKHRLLGKQRLELNSNLLICFGIDTLIQNTKCTLTQLFLNLV